MDTTTTRLAVVVDDTTCAMMQVRRPTEAEMTGIRAEYRADMLYGVPGTHEDLPEIVRRDVWAAIPGKPDGWLPGSNSSAYYVTAEQADALRALNDKYVAEEAERELAEVAAEAEYARRPSQICPRCHSYCYGDCTAN